MRRRLAGLVAAVSAMVALAFLVPLALLVRDLARDRALTAAELEAQSLAPVLALTTDPGAVRPAVQATEAGEEGRLTVFLADGGTVGAAAEPGPAYQLARRGRTFSTPTEGGVEVLVPVVLPDDATAVVRVLVPSATLRRGVTGAWVALAALGVGMTALATAVALRMARSVVRPVEALAGAAHRLGEGDLAVRVDPDGPPEVAETGRAFNRLAGRVRDLLAAEREAAADLSHRLRTPLTALRLDAETVADPEERRRLGEGIEELERAVTRVIADARRPAREGMAGADLVQVTRDRVGFWSVLADEQGRAWSCEAPPGPLPVPVPADDLAAALDALLANVFAHTSDGTAFEITVGREGDGGALLVVEDGGPGFPDPAVVTRGTSGSGSTGLGLDIARRTAEAAGGSLRAVPG
ncbi:MAG: HAMP domain-containing protein, partial [Acidimicrobiales bacterium]